MRKQARNLSKFNPEMLRDTDRQTDIQKDM